MRSEPATAIPRLPTSWNGLGEAERPDNEVGWLVESLVDAGLLDGSMSLAETYPPRVRLTAAGVEELERWLGEPDHPTENLPVPANTVFNNTITVHGDLRGSPLVQGSPSASVTGTFNAQGQELAAFAEGYRRLLGYLDLDDEELETVEADLAAVDDQAGGDVPDQRRWRPSLRRLLGVLSNAAAAGVTSGAHDEVLTLGHQLLGLPGVL